MLDRWLASLADRFLASDHGLIRFRFALRAVLSVTLAVLVLALVKAPAATLLLGAICAMISATSLRTGTTRERAVHLATYLPVMVAAVVVGTLLAKYSLVSDAVFVAVMFTGVYARRFDQFGTGLGTAGFMAYFFALFLHLPAADLPVLVGAVAVGLACTAVAALLVLRDTPASMLRRSVVSIRAQVARLIEELATLLDDDQQLTDAEGLPRGVARQATRMHETTLQIEDNGDQLGLDPQWQRQLVDAELSADRLARTTIRAIASDLDADTRADLAQDLRGLHRFVDRNPEAAFTVDTDELMRRIARYDIRGDPGRQPSDPTHHVLLVHRAIRELLLAVVQLRRTTYRVLTSPPPAGPRPAPGHSRREPTLEDVEQGLLTDSDPDPDDPDPDAPNTDDPDPDDADPDAAALAADRNGYDDEHARPGDHWLSHPGPAHRAPDPDVWDVEPEPSPTNGHRVRAEAGPARNRLPWRWEFPPYLRAAIQVSIGGTLAIIGGTLLSGARWYWAVIAGYIVFAGTTSRGDLLVKGWRRVWGTLLGILAGTLLATLLSGHPGVNLVIALLCIFLAFYSLKVSYATMTFFITVMLGMLYDILGEFTPDLLLLRLEETAVGVTGSILAAMLVLPTRTRATVLTKLHDFFAALHTELVDAARLLVDADRVSVIAATRDVDRAATDLRTAIAPMLHPLSPSRVRRGQAIRLILLTEESALAARNLARAAEPGALLHLPEAAETLHRLIDNTEVLLAATRPDAEPDTEPGALVSGPALAPTVDVRALIEAHSGGGEPDRLAVLHLRRTINCLDRLDKLLLGMALPLSRTISVPLTDSPAIVR